MEACTGISPELQTLIRSEVDRAVAEATSIQRATISAEEAASYVGICVDTIYEECRKRRFPHTKLRGRLVFRISAIDQWLAEQEKLNASGIA